RGICMRKLVFVFLLLGILIVVWYEELYTTSVKDPLLRVEILKELGLMEFIEDRTRPNEEDMAKLTSLVHVNDKFGEEFVSSLAGLEDAANLEELIIPFNEIGSIKPLKNLHNLHTLNLSYSPDPG